MPTRLSGMGHVPAIYSEMLLDGYLHEHRVV